MSRTIDGTAVAMIVESMAMRPVESIMASRTGPRAERSPTLLSVTVRIYPARADSGLFPAAPPTRPPADRALDHGRAVPGTVTARDAERDDAQRVHPTVPDRRAHRPAGGPQQAVDVVGGEPVDPASRVDARRPQDLIGQQVPDP